MSVVIKRVPGPGEKELERIISIKKTLVAKIGWPKAKKYPDNHGGADVATVAAQNEFGNPSKNIPPRPFMRPTIVNKKNSWRNMLASGARAILKGNETQHTVLEKIGLVAAGDMRETISKVMEPKLKPLTILNRLRRRGILTKNLGRNLMTNKLTEKNIESIGGLNKPLIDTHFMYESLTSIVENE